MDYSFFLGIDMSKATFDYALVDKSGTILSQAQVQNQPSEITQWISELEKEFAGLWSSCLVCLEHSGFYTAPLLQQLNRCQTSVWLESALQIKRSSGLQRGKTDSLDAMKIAAYAIDFQRRACLWKPRRESLDRLALLISHRDRMVRSLMSIRNSLTEEQDFIPQHIHHEMQHIHHEMQQISAPAIRELEVCITRFDEQIKELLQKDIEISRQVRIITSIPGFGHVIASKLILTTQGFTRINSARKLACFSGIAPFPHQSGSSIRGRTKVSHYANKEIKKMLHLAALVTIRKGNIMHDYYKRKVGEGKNKMSVINAVRNKLLHILMACIKNNTMYEKKYNHSLA